MATALRSPGKVKSAPTIFCVGYKNKAGKKFILAPAQSNKVHIKTFVDAQSAYVAASAANRAKEVKLGNESYKLEDKESYACVVRTSIEALLLAGWSEFTIDRCELDGTRRSEFQITMSRDCEVHCNMACRVQYLERMLSETT